MEESLKAIKLYLRKNNCILFLGPKFSTNSGGEKVHTVLKKKLEESSISKVVDYSHDNLFLLNQSDNFPKDKGTLTSTIVDTLDEMEGHEVFDKIAQLPFSVIISCSPDTFLRDSYQNQRINHHFEYSYGGAGSVESQLENNKPDQNGVKAPKMKPLLYNLFGSIENTNSLIVTYDDLFSVIISIINEDTKQPEELKNRIKSASAFLFLGFDLSKWYIPLVLHKVNSFRKDLRKDQEEVFALFSQDNLLDSEHTRYLPHQVNLSELNSIELINSLFETMPSKFKLGEDAMTKANNVKDRHIEMLGNNQIDELLDSLQILTKNKDESIYMDLIHQNSRHREITEEYQYSTISNENMKIEMNKIRRSVGEIIKQIDFNELVK